MKKLKTLLLALILSCDGSVPCPSASDVVEQDNAGVLIAFQCTLVIQETLFCLTISEGPDGNPEFGLAPVLRPYCE